MIVKLLRRVFAAPRKEVIFKVVNLFVLSFSSITKKYHLMMPLIGESSDFRFYLLKQQFKASLMTVLYLLKLLF